MYFIQTEQEGAEHGLFLCFSPGWPAHPLLTGLKVNVHIIPWSLFYMTTQISVLSSKQESFTLQSSKEPCEFQPTLDQVT